MPNHTSSTTSYTHLTKDNRNEIKVLLEKGYSHTDIARALGVHKSSISREIRRNSVKGAYDPARAQHKARTRRKSASFRGKKIITPDGELRRYVEERLKRGWSPELISGRLERVRTDLPYVSKNTIYRYLTTPYGSATGYRRQSRRSGGGHGAGSPDNRTFIDERPHIADMRARLGDWELDFIESGKSSTAALLVLVDRLSRYTIAALIENKRIATVHDAVGACVTGVPVHTITTDNDISLQRHEELAAIVRAAVYFCHPYASWEKGTVEHVNGRLREVFPKGCDLGAYTQEDVDDAVRTLNTRPRKCLDYLTPEEVMMRRGGLRADSHRGSMPISSSNQSKNTRVGCCT